MENNINIGGSTLTKENDTKCAPSKEYEDGSCLKIDALKNLAKIFNATHNENINIKQSKENLVDQLEDKMKEKYNCNDQICWTKQEFINKLDEDILEDIMDHTFLPEGPGKKHGWLSTSNINEVIEQYHDIHKDFVFLGAVPYDFDDLKQLEIKDLNFTKLEKDGKHKIGMVINLDEHYKAGSHWVALFADLKQKQVYFFDSVGKVPGHRIRKFVNRITKYLYRKKYNKDLDVNDVLKEMKNIDTTNMNQKYVNNLLKGGFDIRYNHIQHQFNNSECGVYSINFILRLVEGESFDNIINNITKDEVMNKNRKIYFRNIN